MATSGQNTTIYAGDTDELDFTVYDDDGVTPLDLTGATIAWNLLRFPGDAGTALIAKANGTGITVTAPSSGTFTVALAALDTAGIPRGRYYHAAKVTDATSHVTTIATGFLTVCAKAVT